MTGPTLASTVAALVNELGDATADISGGSTTWSRGPVAFAILQGRAVELRLDRAIAAAALRTPETAPSPRGPEWVVFAPSTLDGHDLDRLEAWLALAFRRAAPGNAAG